MSFQPPNSLAVEVRHLEDGDLAKNVHVILRTKSEDAKEWTLGFVESAAAYLATDIAVGDYEVEVRDEGYKAQKRAVSVQESRHHENFILGASEHVSYFQRGKVQIPFYESELIAVLFTPETSGEEMGDSLENWQREHGLVVDEEIPQRAREHKARLLRFQDDSPKKTMSEVVAALCGEEKVQRAGPLVSFGEETISFLTNELIVRFKEKVEKEEAREHLAPVQPKYIREIPYIPHGFHVESEKVPSYELLEEANGLMENPAIDWVEPNLAGTAAPDELPEDPMWQDLWDRRLAQLPGAWQHLKNAGKEPHGDPNLVFAVVDTGIDSSHPEFQGTVSNGQPKIFRSYDFRRMEEGNPQPLENSAHGTKVAGVAAARAGNEGLVGAAPNCRIMGLIYPATELETLDMYYWAAGFEVHSLKESSYRRAPFPAPPSRGADIFITCVGFGFSIGTAISGAASAMIDFLAENGRDGKGCLFFCSAGNQGRRCAIERPWTSHDKVFGIGASTLRSDGKTEVRAEYSNFGPLELCAPSSDGAGRKTWTTNLMRRGNNYTQFSGTSSATPLAAGTAALVLSAKPELTWLEVRTILRSTAQPIHSEEELREGLWFDKDGNPFSGKGKPAYSFWYGYGRIDASRAVAAALHSPQNFEKRHKKARVPGNQFSLSGSLLKKLFWALGGYHVFLGFLRCMGQRAWSWRLFLTLAIYNFILGSMVAWCTPQVREDERDEEDELMPINPPSSGGGG